MASTGLHGPYPLTNKEINRVVTGVGPGTYALGPTNESGGLIITRIGRSDDDLNDRLHDYVKFAHKYPYFKYGFWDTAKTAYEHECRMWHDFKPTNNPNHPDKPDGTNYPCPVPGCPH